MSALLAVPIDAAYWLVSALAGVLAPLPGGLAAAAAIVAFTIGVRLLVLPLGYYAFRGERARARLAPKVAALHRRHAHQPERLQHELATLYRQEGGLFTGCLPALLQVPFFAVVYRLFLSARIAGGPNVLLRQHLLGVPLGSHWLSGTGPLSAQGLVFCGLFLLLALIALLSVRLARRSAAAGPVPGGIPGGLTGPGEDSRRSHPTGLRTRCLVVWGRGGAASRSSSESRPWSENALIETTSIPLFLPAPWRTAFSTSGCRTKLGTAQLARPGSIRSSKRRRSPKRRC